MKPSVKRNLFLDFLGDIIVPQKFNRARAYKLNDKPLQKGDVLYVMTRELRLEDNWGFIFAYKFAQKENKKFKVVIHLDDRICSQRQKEFREKGLSFLKRDLDENSIDYVVVEEDLLDAIKDVGLCVVDFNPIAPFLYAEELSCVLYEIDSHNIIPSRYISSKQEFAAATLRRKVYANIAEFLTEYDNIFDCRENEAKGILADFIKNKLHRYSTDKNDPNKQAVSELSSYMHFGFISSQRIALEVLKSDVSRENKETFLEELIVRKELSDNFCLYNENYNNSDSALSWARETLNNHKLDVRTYIYTQEEFEEGLTHDDLWNAAQKRLLKTGKMHGFIRMYWAKKILEWSPSYQEAVRIAIYLNDKYALDGNDPNGYVGVLWSIVGLHDRAFFTRPVFGKIRYMSYEGCKKKFDVDRYIKSIY